MSYTVFVNDLFDLVLRGRRSASNGLAARYAETGEVPDLTMRVKAVSRERKKG